jgi:hypothetical protein
LKKVFRAPRLIRRKKTKDFFRQRAIDEFVSQRQLKVKEKVWNEVWYQTAMAKADKENLAGARFYCDKK